MRQSILVLLAVCVSLTDARSRGSRHVMSGHVGSRHVTSGHAVPRQRSRRDSSYSSYNWGSQHHAGDLYNLLRLYGDDNDNFGDGIGDNDDNNYFYNSGRLGGFPSSSSSSLHTLGGFYGHDDDYSGGYHRVQNVHNSLLHMLSWGDDDPDDRVFTPGGYAGLFGGRGQRPARRRNQGFSDFDDSNQRQRSRTNQGLLGGTNKGLVGGTNKGLIGGTNNGLIGGTNQGLIGGTNRGVIGGTNQGIISGSKEDVY